MKELESFMVSINIIYKHLIGLDMNQEQPPTQLARTEIRTANESRNRTTNQEARGGKYAVDQLTFPQDLFTSGPAKYANSWVMININMLEQSNYLKELADVNLDAAEREQVNRRQTVADQRNNGSPASAIAQAAVSGAAVGAVKSLSDVNISKYIGPAATGARGRMVREDLAKVGRDSLKGAAITAVSVAPALLYAGTAKRETKRIAAAIQLPMPNQLNTRYSAGWSEDATNVFDAMMRGAANVTEGGMTEGLAAAGLGANAIAQNYGLSAATGLAVNPKKEMYFHSVGFREFDLAYKLYPKNEQEARILKNIIFQLKFHMHPEYKAEGRYTFIYPSEFDITFFHKGVENTWINKIATCVLTDFTVDYTPDGLWAQHDKGIPNVTQITMKFKELTVLTKEMIDEGF